MVLAVIVNGTSVAQASRRHHTVPVVPVIVVRWPWRRTDFKCFARELAG